MNSWIDLHALWQIVVVGLIAGAGLPALFAVGLRALSLPGGRPGPATEEGQVVGGSIPGMIAAGLCFAVVLAGIGWGIYYIVAGT
ncbi:hypothetical protein [Streptacidiphilus sp. P02-A3a]|uniref:hypothetical protein n=1 Tax=Streptacidiphilus sp. P02-A3a TaxID=2704468 RepID=UPI0015FD9E58|nr:hypothetical protein [Streptacidiphilus sp. P02-A3a]QMU72466.1 hypothetical protein GXP74_33690 [Streptacidiphilus sp. P02-A3a]